MCASSLLVASTSGVCPKLSLFLIAGVSPHGVRADREASVRAGASCRPIIEQRPRRPQIVDQSAAKGKSELIWRRWLVPRGAEPGAMIHRVSRIATLAPAFNTQWRNSAGTVPSGNVLTRAGGTVNSQRSLKKDQRRGHSPRPLAPLAGPSDAQRQSDCPPRFFPNGLSGRAFRNLHFRAFNIRVTGVAARETPGQAVFNVDPDCQHRRSARHNQIAWPRTAYQLGVAVGPASMRRRSRARYSTGAAGAQP